MDGLREKLQVSYIRQKFPKLVIRLQLDEPGIGAHAPVSKLVVENRGRTLERINQSCEGQMLPLFDGM
jgi:hypothetical protein